MEENNQSLPQNLDQKPVQVLQLLEEVPTCCFECMEPQTEVNCKRCYRSYHRRCMRIIPLGSEQGFNICWHCVMKWVCRTCQKRISEPNRLCVCRRCFRHSHMQCTGIDFSALHTVEPWEHWHHLCKECVKSRKVSRVHQKRSVGTKMYSLVSLRSESPSHCGWVRSELIEQQGLLQLSLQAPNLSLGPNGENHFVRIIAHRDFNGEKGPINFRRFLTEPFSKGQIRTKKFGDDHNLFYLTLWTNGSYSWEDEVTLYTSPNTILRYVITKMRASELSYLPRDLVPLFKYNIPKRQPQHASNLRAMLDAKLVVSWKSYEYLMKVLCDFFNYCFFQRNQGRILYAFRSISICNLVKTLELYCPLLKYFVKLTSFGSTVKELKPSEQIRSDTFLLAVPYSSLTPAYLDNCKQLGFTLLVMEDYKTSFEDLLSLDWLTGILMCVNSQNEQLLNSLSPTYTVLPLFTEESSKEVTTVSRALALIYETDRFTYQNSEIWSQLKRIIFLRFVISFGFNFNGPSLLLARLISFEPGVFSSSDEPLCQIYIKRFLTVLSSYSFRQASQSYQHYYTFGLKVKFPPTQPSDLFKRVCQLKKLQQTVEACNSSFDPFPLEKKHILYVQGQKMQLQKWQPCQDYILACLVLSKGYDRWIDIMNSGEWLTLGQNYVEKVSGSQWHFTKNQGMSFGQHVKQDLMNVEQKAVPHLSQIIAGRAAYLLKLMK